VFQHRPQALNFLVMAAVHGVGETEDRRQLGDKQITIFVETGSVVKVLIIYKISGIIADRACDHLTLLRGKADDLRSHDDPVGTFRHVRHTDIFTAVMKLHGNLEKKTLPGSHAVNLLHTVKNGKGELRGTQDVILTAGVTFADIP